MLGRTGQIEIVKSFTRFTGWVVFSLLLSPALGKDGAPFKAANPPEMKRLMGTDSPAHHAAKWFMRGANLGDYLEVQAGGNWGVTVGAEEFATMRREGFDHVRVPIRWSDYAGQGPEFALESKIFARVDFVVTNA